MVLSTHEISNEDLKDDRILNPDLDNPGSIIILSECVKHQLLVIKKAVDGLLEMKESLV